MRINLLPIICAFCLGAIITPNLIIYRMSCDTSKFGWQWASQRRFERDGFICKDSNQRIEREVNTYMILQTIKLELFSGGEK